MFAETDLRGIPLPGLSWATVGDSCSANDTKRVRAFHYF